MKNFDVFLIVSSHVIYVCAKRRWSETEVFNMEMISLFYQRKCTNPPKIGSEFIQQATSSGKRGTFPGSIFTGRNIFATVPKTNENWNSSFNIFWGSISEGFSQCLCQTFLCNFLNAGHNFFLFIIGDSKRFLKSWLTLKIPIISEDWAIHHN